MDVALTRIGLPVMEEREVWKDVHVPVATGASVVKEPGDTISKNELKDLGWPDEKITADLQALREGKSIGSQDDYKAMVKAEEDAKVAQAEAEAKLIEKFRASQAGGES